MSLVVRYRVSGLGGRRSKTFTSKSLSSVRVNKCITYFDESVMLSFHLYNTVSDLLDVSDFINYRPRNVFSQTI